MKQFTHSLVVEREIDAVWKFYTDIKHLEIVTPKTMNLEIISSQNEVLQQGTVVWLRAKLITKSRWHSKITYLKPFEYMDEMNSGRFNIWRHLDRFFKMDEKNGGNRSN